MAKQKILVADNDLQSLRLLEVSLRKSGYTVTTAVDGIDALEKIDLDPPDLIISDTIMPRLNGFDLCEKIKTNPKSSIIPFIFLTQEKGIENKVKGLELGAEDYLTKPIFIREIVTRIKVLLNRRLKERLEQKEIKTRFSGSLEDMGIVDLIQTFEISRKSGVIYLSFGNQAGAIYFSEGEIIDAQLSTLKGENAIYRFFLWPTGNFEIEFRTVREEKTIQLTTHALLMEGLRRLDEWGRISEQLPSLDRVCEINYSNLAEKLAELPDQLNSILRLFDGKRNLFDVVNDSAFEDLESLSLISKLYFEKLIIDPLGEPGPSEIKEKVEGVLEVKESPQNLGETSLIDTITAKNIEEQLLHIEEAIDRSTLDDAEIKAKQQEQAKQQESIKQEKKPISEKMLREGALRESKQKFQEITPKFEEEPMEEKPQSKEAIPEEHKKEPVEEKVQLKEPTQETAKIQEIEKPSEESVEEKSKEIEYPKVAVEIKTKEITPKIEKEEKIEIEAEKSSKEEKVEEEKKPIEKIEEQKTEPELKDEKGRASTLQGMGISGTQAKSKPEKAKEDNEKKDSDEDKFFAGDSYQAYFGEQDSWHDLESTHSHQPKNKLLIYITTILIILILGGGIAIYVYNNYLDPSLEFINIPYDGINRATLKSSITKDINTKEKVQKINKLEKNENIQEKKIATNIPTQTDAGQQNQVNKTTDNVIDAGNAKQLDNKTIDAGVQTPTIQPGSVEAKRESDKLTNKASRMMDNKAKQTEAIAMAEKAVELNPDNAMAWLVIGYIKNQQGNNEESKNAYQKCITIGGPPAIDCKLLIKQIR